MTEISLSSSSQDLQLNRAVIDFEFSRPASGMRRRSKHEQSQAAQGHMRGCGVMPQNPRGGVSGRAEARQRVNQGGFAGAVGFRQADDASEQGDVEVCQDLPVAERHGQFIQFDEGLHDAGPAI